MTTASSCAIEDACNHAGASLNEGWRVDDDIQEDPCGPCIACPVHGYIFDLRTGALVQPHGLCDAQRRFRATLQGDDVLVEDDFVLTILR